MVLGTYGVQALTGLFFDLIYLVVNAVVGEAGSLGEIFVGFIFLTLIAAIVGVLMAAVKSVPDGLSGVLRSFKRM